MRKKKFLIGKIALTVISLVGVIAFKINSYNIPTNYAEVLYDVCVGIFSAMILVWFIDEISKHIQERQSRNKELIAIKRFDSVLQRYIEQYITMYYCVATPLQERNFDNVKMPESFTLKDMRDLHQTSLLVKEGVSNGSVDAFLQIELELRKELISLTEKNDFDYYPRFAELFLDYIQCSLRNDCRAGISSNLSLIHSNKNQLKEIHDLLENHGEDYYNRALNEENFPATLIHPYMYLYEMMKMERRIIIDYQTEIEKINYKKPSLKKRFINCIRKWIQKIMKGVSCLKKPKAQLFWAKYGRWIIAGFTLLATAAIIFLFCKFNLFEKISSWKGETVAVIGTLLGAIIGGVFTLIGSIYVNKKHLKAQTHIKRKNLIYKPLYDELCEIENDVLATNPYPSMIFFETLDRASQKFPQYTVWGRIKSDTRYLETPKILIEEIDKLYNKIGNYINARNNDNEMMTELANEILQEVIGTKCSLINFGDCIIKHALNDIGAEVFKQYKDCLKEKVDVTDEQWKQADDKFYEKCRENETIINIKSARQEWDLQQKKVIELLTDLIQYVNIKYEG